LCPGITQPSQLQLGGYDEGIFLLIAVLCVVVATVVAVGMAL